MNNPIGLKSSRTKLPDKKKLSKKEKKTELLGPYKREQFSYCDERIDLSDNTNHFLGENSHYPDIFYTEIKKGFLNHVIPAISGGLQVNLKEENLLITNGVVSAIDLILKSFCTEDSLVVYPKPSFSAFKYFSKVYRVRMFETILQGKNYEKIDFSSLKDLKPRVFFICDPNNPIGSSIDHDDIYRLLIEFPETLFVIDETYHEYSLKNTHLIKLLHHKNLIVLRNLSKGWGLASLRIGTICADEHIIRELLLKMVPFPVSEFSSLYFQYHIQNRVKFIKQSWSLTNRERDLLGKSLRSLNSIDRVFDSDTNFLCVKIKNAEKIVARLFDNGVKVELVGKDFPNAIRVTVGTKLENSYFLNTLSEVLQENLE